MPACMTPSKVYPPLCLFCRTYWRGLATYLGEGGTLAIPKPAIGQTMRFREGKKHA
jgi:hypothetical protein